MAESYAVQPGDTVAAAGGEMVPVRAGTQGGGQGYGLDLAPGYAFPTAGKDLDAILKIGEHIFAPAIKKEQEAKFTQGMYRVAQGEAVADIEKDASSWTDIYGPNYVVEGAKAGSAQSRASILAAEAEGKMDELAQLPPEEMQKWYTKRVGELSTGQGDELFVGMAMKESAPVFKQHSKLRYRFQQEEANTADRTYIGTEIGRFEGVLRESKRDPARYSEADLAEARWKMLDAFIPNPGQNPKTKQQNTVDAITAMASTGNFLAIQAIREGLGQDEKGNPIKPFEGLDPKVRDNLERTLQTEGARYNWRSVTGDTFNALQQFYATNHTLTAAEAAQQIDKINAGHKAATGIDVPLISNHEAVTVALQNSKAADRHAAKVAEQEAKEKQKQGEIEKTRAMLLVPGGRGVLQGEMDADRLKDANFKAGEQLAFEQVQAEDDAAGGPPKKTWAYINANPAYKLPSVDNFFKTSFNAALASPNVGTAKAFALLQVMTPAQRQTYLDGPTNNLYDAFSFAQLSGTNVNEQWASAVVAARSVKEMAPEERKAKSKAAVEAFDRVADPSWWNFGEETLAGFGRNYVKAEAERAAQFYQYTGEGLQDRTIAYIRSSPNYTIMGPNIVANSAPGLVPLETALNPTIRADGKRDVKYTKAELDVAFHLKVNEIAKRFKKDPDEIALIRMPDDKNGPRFAVDIATGTMQYITGRDLTKHIDDGEVLKWQKLSKKTRPAAEPAVPIGLASDY